LPLSEKQGVGSSILPLATKFVVNICNYIQKLCHKTKIINMKKYVVSSKNIINFFVITSLAFYLFIYIYKYEKGALKDYYLFFDRTDRFADILKVLFSTRLIYFSNYQKSNF